MAGKAKNRDENGRKLPWRPSGSAPATAADHPHAQERARYRHKPDGVPTPLPGETQRNSAALRRLEKDAFPPVLTPAPQAPNPRLLTDAQLAQLVKDLARADRYDWRANARPEQLEPEDYDTWVLNGGRGMGKTRTGAETVRDWSERQGLRRIAVIAKASRELRDVCFEGVSGLLACIPPDQILNYRKGLGDTYIDLKNGTKIIGFTAEAPDSIRGHAFDAVWGDEFAAWPKHLAQDMLDQAAFTMRESKDPRMILTTTPKRVAHLMELLERAETDKRIVITKGKTTDNTALSKKALRQLYARYAGTHLGRQELDGELLNDVEGALWIPEMIEASRWSPGEDDEQLPKFRKVIVGVDPSGSANGDATGIVVLAYTGDRRMFVLGCYSTKGLPGVRYTAVCKAAERHAIPGVPLEMLVEYNYGGDNAAFAIDKQWKHLVEAGDIDAGLRKPLIKPSTLRGDKAVKASPVAALYEQQMKLGISRIYHMVPTRQNGLDKLENEQLSWAVTDKQSPNSMDALVVAARRAMQELGLEVTLGQASNQRRIQGGWRPF